MVEAIEESCMSNPGEADNSAEVEDIEADEIEQVVDETDADEPDEADGETDEPPVDGGEDEAPAVTAKPRSAATIAVQEAKRAAKEATARAEAVQAELNNLRQAHNGRSQAEQQAEENARLQYMSPDEKVDYFRSKDRQEFNAKFGQLEFRMSDSADRTAFEALCARDPSLATVRDATEARLADFRRGGANPPREMVATLLLGQRARERAAKGGKARQAAKGASRVQSQRVAAPSGRSDVKGGDSRRGGNDAAARRARLENQNI